MQTNLKIKRRGGAIFTEKMQPTYFPTSSSKGCVRFNGHLMWTLVVMMMALFCVFPTTGEALLDDGSDNDGSGIAMETFDKGFKIKGREVMVESRDGVGEKIGRTLKSNKSRVKFHRQEQSITDPQDSDDVLNNDRDNNGAALLDHVTNDVSEILSDIQLVSANNDMANDGPDTLKASASALALVKDRISNPELISALPVNFQPIFKTLVQELSSAEHHVKVVNDLVSEHYMSSVDQKRVVAPPTNSSTRRLVSAKDFRFSPADYHARVKSMQQHHHHPSHGRFDHQQGYHRARTSRQEGMTRRQLSEDDGGNSICVDVDPNDRKKDQCIRLARCARNYNLYDLFVFLFGDDINFDTGSIDDKEKIKASDEKDMIQKLDSIKKLSTEIISEYEDAFLDVNGKCDKLLQNFHRFDEDLSVKGKWQGGSVTGVCRGWGTNKFMTLESIYHITDTVLNVKERVESCIESLVSDFNSRLGYFEIPEEPCKEELKAVNVNEESEASDAFMSDIRQKFECLYYSFLVKKLKSECKSTVCKNACLSMPLNPVFVAKSRWGGISEKRVKWWGSDLFGDVAVFRGLDKFDYEIPVVLPSRVDRSIRPLSHGNFFLDTVTTQDELMAESFILEVFDEYMGCASNVVKSIGREIFDGVQNKLYNPYAPTNPEQFEIPLAINDKNTDDHGQITAHRLNEIFEYKAVGDNGGIITSGTPQLSGGLKQSLALFYSFDQRIDDLIKSYEECMEDDNEDKAKVCKKKIQQLKPLTFDYFENGLDRSSLDTSIALLWGNKTTIGQVCSFARGLEDVTVEDVPGFCCLDAPYQAENWGEKFSCQKYEALFDGSTKVVQKDRGDCKKLGPVTAGFNEAACDIFHGTWCPTPRNCFNLNKCIQEAKEDAKKSRSREAFFEYLDEAPLVEDYDDSTKCGDLREYFDYDRDYPDDDRICEEVNDLQCFTDFSNLDGFATGTAGPGSGLEELAVSEKVALISKTPFDSSASKAWRSANFALRKAIEIGEFIREQTKSAETICITFVSALPGSAAPCVAPAAAGLFTVATLVFTLHVAVDISERIYSELVDGQDSEFDGDIKMSTYNNVITNHQNILTTFRAIQQVKVMLGELSEGLTNDDDEPNGRRLQSDCVSTKDGFVTPCDKVSCEDPARMCDGGFNFRYVAYLRGAGCDDLDSDGDGEYDVCEDRYPPELVVRDAQLFRCDEDDSSRLFYDGKVFKSEKQVKNFLEYQFPAIDDCASTNKLEVQIEHEFGSCSDTVYKVTPAQNIPSCHDREPAGKFAITYENPLVGPSKMASVQLDDEAPVVQCGFRPDSSSLNEVHGKNLYHYMLEADRNSLKLSDARFFYDIADNCDNLGDVDVKVKVKTNEGQQNKIADLLQHNVGDSVEQVTLLYAASSCHHMNADLFCQEDPTMGSLKFRFYDITVTASDSAGNIGSDTCKVVIVPSCSPHESQCQILKTGKGAKKGAKNTAFGHYFAIDLVEKTIAKSQTLFGAVEANLVWEHGLEPPKRGKVGGQGGRNWVGAVEANPVWEHGLELPKRGKVGGQGGRGNWEYWK